MKNVILLRFGELFLKGDNRHIFENMLISNIKTKLSCFEFKFEKTFGRYIISNYQNSLENDIVNELRKVFGLHSLSLAKEVEADRIAIENIVKSIDCKGKSFKVSVKRADKRFPIPSMEFAKILGGVVLDNCKTAYVDLYKPQIEIHVDIRLNGKAYIYTDEIKCQGGLPLGSAGRGLLLLSGGIDSPVAGYLIAKRGLKIEALHFNSYPYTSVEAKDKVISLAEKLCDYAGSIKLHIISFTRVQEEIHKRCKPEYMITIMRRIMMRVASKLCDKYNLGCIITGESLGQVASQTMQSMAVTGAMSNKPIFRPCIAMDKEEIMKVAREIDTYDISILPYEDCCTVFLPKNPVIKPVASKVEKEEGYLSIDDLINDCMEGEEIIEIRRSNK